MTLQRSLIPLALTGLALLALTAPGALAQEVQEVRSTVLLHDLVEDDAYVGCHVTTPSFTSYRATVREDQHVILTVQAPQNNTNAHYLTVEGVDGQSDTITGGQSTTFEFDVTGAGSKAVKCDGQTSNLQGVLIVRAADSGGSTGDETTPGPGALLALVGVGAAALVGRRAHRRSDD